MPAEPMTAGRVADNPDDALAELLFADAGAALLLLDETSQVRRANPAARAAFGEACQPGALAADLFALADRPAVRGLLAASRDRQPDAMPEAAVCIGGCWLVTAEPWLADGAAAGLLLRAIDLPRLRQLDPEQTQAAKLQALSLLAGGIAHDFNNLLTAVLGAAEAAAERIVAATPDAATIEDLRTIQDGATRGQDLVRQLLAIGRQQTLQPRVIGANRAVTELARLLRRVLGDRVRLELVLEEPGREVRVDPGQLDQVLINLAANARNAMPKGGTLTVRTGHATLLRPLPTSLAPGADSVPPGRYVTLTLADTGVGIPLEHLPHLFDPFYTTRRGQGGNGLGLASVHGIVRQSQGYVGVASTPGVGTSFTVYLPRHVAAMEMPAMPAAAPPVAPQSLPPAAGNWVLLVEDEELVRRLAARTLRQHGHHVIECGSAEAALELLAIDDGWDRLAVIVSDVMLPGLDGPGLVQEVRRHRPGLPAVLVSGYADAAQRAVLAADGSCFLAKPYSQKTLAESVAAALPLAGAKRVVG